MAAPPPLPPRLVSARCSSPNLFAGTIGNGKGDNLCVGTNGHKIIARKIAADLPTTSPRLIPKRSVEKRARMVKDWTEVYIEINEQRFVAAFGATRFTTKLCEGSYVD